MAVISAFVDVPYVEEERYIFASENTDQMDSLQSRDVYLLNKFLEYYNRDEIDNLFSSYTTNLDWKESVNTYDDILTTYPDPDDGWVVNVKDTNYTYRYDEEDHKWIAISANAIPLATTEVNGLLSKRDYALIRSLGLESILKSLGFINDNGEIVDLQGVLNSSIIPNIYMRLNQIEERSLPLGSIIPYVDNDSVPPLGFVFAEGGEYNREEYPDMWAKLCKEENDGFYCVEDSDRDRYPGRFTKGDNINTFRVPDLRGCFIRGVDFNKGLDSYEDREIGSFENDSIREHKHEIDVVGVGSIDDNRIENGKLFIAGTTENDYNHKAVINIYNSSDAETRPKNIALRFIVKMIPTEKLPLLGDPLNAPGIEYPIDAETLHGRISSVSPGPDVIPITNGEGKLGPEWFDIEAIADENFVRRNETSDFPDANKIPISNDDHNLDDWLTITTEEDVDKWIIYLSNVDYDLGVDDYDDRYGIDKKFLTRKKFIKFLKGLREFIRTFKQVYTTEEIEPTNERGYISNAERIKYSDKYTKNETYQLLYNFLQSYIPLADASVSPSPNKIPIANEEGKLDPGWMSDLFLNKIGENDTTGYVEVGNNEVSIKSGIKEQSLTGNVTIEGGGLYSNIEISPAKATIGGYNTSTTTGGNILLEAGSGGENPFSTGGSVIIKSGSGVAYNGNIELNDIKVSKSNVIYTDKSKLILKQNEKTEDINNTNYLELSNDGFTYMHDNLVDDSDDYILTINKDGTVDTNKPNIPNSFAILNERGLVNFDNLPQTVKVNNIGEFVRNQYINTNMGNVIIGEITQNSNIEISDDTADEEARELTFILDCRGPYNLNWPVNVNWLGEEEPLISYGEKAIIKLLRSGNGEWIGWKVGDSSTGGSSNEILINNTEVPPDSFNGELHIWIEEEEEVEPEEPIIEPEELPSIGLSGIAFNTDSSHSTTTESEEIILTETDLNR